MLLRDEIFEQPSVLETVLARNNEVAAQARAILTDSDVRHVVLAARGTSDNAARYAKYVWGTTLGVPATLAAPSLYTRYNSPPRLSTAAVVGISQSGQSPDLLAVLEEGKRQGRPTIAIVNDPDSPLADLADVVIPLHAGAELSVAATKSYTASLLTVGMIAGLGDELASVPMTTADTLALEDAIAELVAQAGPVSKAVVLGRGYNHSTAFEWALKLQEMAYVFAHAFSTADFAHGPFAVLEPGFPVFALLPQGAITDDSLSLLQRAHDEGQARVSLITNITDTGLPSVVTPAMPESTSPIAFITAAQLFTLHMALARGIDPETPRGLNKVTRTS